MLLTPELLKSFDVGPIKWHDVTLYKAHCYQEPDGFVSGVDITSIDRLKRRRYKYSYKLHCEYYDDDSIFIKASFKELTSATVKQYFVNESNDVFKEFTVYATTLEAAQERAEQWRKEQLLNQH